MMTRIVLKQINRNMLLVVGFILLFCGLTPITQANVIEDWVKRYDNGDEDYAVNIAVDPTGNIFVTGNSDDSITEDDITTIKYDADGTELWVRRYDHIGDDTTDVKNMVLDEVGNIYVTGKSRDAIGDSDFVTIKYDTEGTELWNSRFDSGYYDSPAAMDIDTEGNVYLTGRVNRNLATMSDYVTVKYDDAGNEVWSIYYDYMGCDEDSNDIEVDSMGNVYITGYSSNCIVGYTPSTTIKYDTDGNELWISHSNFDHDAIAIALDTMNNIYVTGEGDSESSGTYCTTIKYDVDGNEDWVQRYRYSEGWLCTPTDIALDIEGNIYVSATSKYPDTGHYTTIKYDAEGTELWVRDYGQGGINIATAMALDDGGNVYITGASKDTLTNYDYCTVKYNPEGEELWIHYYDHVGEQDAPMALVVDSIGHVFVTGGSEDDELTGVDYATIKYTQIAIPEEADLVLDMSGPSTVIQKDQLTYSLTITNQGPKAATGVQFTNTLPKGVKCDMVTPSQGSCSQSKFTINCELGDMENAAHATIDLTVLVSRRGAFTNLATVGAASPIDPNLSNNTASLTVVSVGEN